MTHASTPLLCCYVMLLFLPFGKRFTGITWRNTFSFSFKTFFLCACWGFRFSILFYSFSFSFGWYLFIDILWFCPHHFKYIHPENFIGRHNDWMCNYISLTTVIFPSQFSKFNRIETLVRESCFTHIIVVIWIRFSVIRMMYMGKFPNISEVNIRWKNDSLTWSNINENGKTF